MNNFFKQLLGSIVQIGINELSKKKVAKQQPTPSLRDTPPIGGAKRESKRGFNPSVSYAASWDKPNYLGDNPPDCLLPQKGSQEDLKIGGED